MSGNPVRTGSDTANSVRKKVRMNLDVTDKENKDEELENPVIPWYCNLNEDLRHNTCGAEEESSEQWEQDLEDQGLDFTIDHHAPSDSVPSASAVPSLVDNASYVSDRTRHGRATRRPVRYQD